MEHAIDELELCGGGVTEVEGTMFAGGGLRMTRGESVTWGERVVTGTHQTELLATLAVTWNMT